MKTKGPRGNKLTPALSRREQLFTAEKLLGIAQQIEDHAKLIREAAADLAQGPDTVVLKRGSESGTQIGRALEWLSVFSSEARGRCSAAKWEHLRGEK